MRQLLRNLSLLLRVEAGEHRAEPRGFALEADAFCRAQDRVEPDRLVSLASKERADRFVAASVPAVRRLVERPRAFQLAIAPHATRSPLLTLRPGKPEVRVERRG